MGHVDVEALIHVGIDVKYYFDTKNLSSAISFANPYLLAGFGAYSQTISSFTASTTQPADTSIGMGIGGGLEFALSPKKAYLEIEGRYHIVTFQDTFTQNFSSEGIPDLTGGVLHDQRQSAAHLVKGREPRSHLLRRSRQSGRYCAPRRIQKSVFLEALAPSFSCSKNHRKRAQQDTPPRRRPPPPPPPPPPLMGRPYARHFASVQG